MKKNIKHIIIIFGFLFLMLIFNLGYFYFFKSEQLVSNSYNPRINYNDPNIKRGDIVDCNGVVLATSYYENGSYQREYIYPEEFAHIVGHQEYGATGIEAKYNFQLEKLSHQFLQRINNLIFGNEMVGNSVVLTIDSGLQQMIYQEMGNQKGAVVVMDPSTGEILAMVSNPTYNPNNLDEEWEELQNDPESPLINRATQGLYPPGSVFKIVTVLSALENTTEKQNRIYECYGIQNFENSSIQCFNGNIHGTENMEEAFAESCNTYFATLGVELGAENLKNTAEQLYFNEDYFFTLDHVNSSFVLDENSPESEVITTAIGQGETLVTPLHMCMITSAVANDGIMMQPYIVNNILTKNGKQKDKTSPKSMDRVMSSENSQIITDMMVAVVDEGTATAAQINGISVAAKTGTAENSSGADHGWFVAFAPADEPEVALSILYENSNGPSQAILLGKDIIEYVI